MHTGTIVEYHREHFTVALDENQREVIAKPRYWEAAEEKRKKKEFSKLGATVIAQQATVGDRVSLSEPEPDHFVIEDIADRSSWLARKGTLRFGRHLQLVVANADQLAVVVSPKPRIAVSLVDRYFLAALQGGIDPLLIVNKLDLDPELPDLEDLRCYPQLGYRVIFTSALRGDGMQRLASELRGKTTAFCGLSGVGKSTILSSITGVDIATQPVKKAGTGRQTTVDSRLYFLPSGGAVIDTPGIRVFGLTQLSRRYIRGYFRDLFELARGCRFSNCTHTHEPDCAIRQAIHAGELAASRLESFHKLIAEPELKYWERIMK
jgi:ribosome biogenesis GTPase